MSCRAAALVLLCLLGCKLGPDYRRPNIDQPTQWRTQAATPESLANLPWWTLFKDPVLIQLVSTSLTNNQDLRIATARIEEAHGFYRTQRAALFPTLDATGSWTRSRVGNIASGGGTTGNQFDLGGLLSYEVDIWGRLRRLTEAARADLLAAEEGRRTVYITLIGNVASSYLELLALDEQLAIARRTVGSRRKSLALTQDKFDNGRGIVSELDVRQAETLLYGAEATVYGIERLIALRENEISLLLGVNPGPVPRGKPLDQQELTEAIPAGLPSELLLRRPDIRAAEAQLIAANANIGAARAAFFPTISLTAALGLQSVEVEDLFDTGLSRAWRFTPRVLAPIFQGGRLRAGVQVASARQQAALVAYEQAIRNGFREVEDALVSAQKLHQQFAAQQKTVEAERARLELAELRYEGGVASYIEVLDSQRFLFAEELNLANLRRDRLVAIVQLYRALGGGW